MVSKPSNSTMSCHILMIGWIWLEIHWSDRNMYISICNPFYEMEDNFTQHSAFSPYCKIEYKNQRLPKKWAPTHLWWGSTLWYHQNQVVCINSQIWIRMISYANFDHNNLTNPWDFEQIHILHFFWIKKFTF